MAFISKSCTSNTGFINIDAIKSVVNSFKDHLQINGCKDYTNCEYFNGNLTNSNLKTPSEMFIYLVKCSDSLNPWFKFYESIFQNQSSDQMVLTINKVLKRTKVDHEDLFNIAAKILKNIEELFSLNLKPSKNITEEMENLLEQKKVNRREGNN